MAPVDMEWPSFAGVPDDDELTAHRPKSQDLARWVWFDGSLRESDQVRIHYYSNALHYGTAVFEGIRCYPARRGTALLRLGDHVERLLNSAALYGMVLPQGPAQIERAALELTARNGIQDGYLRPLAFYGRGPIDLKPRGACPVHLLVAIRSLGTFLGEAALRNGIRVTVSRWRKCHQSMMPTAAKASGQYANNVLAAHEALDRGFDDALMLNSDDTVASATGMNVFFVRDGRLCTNDVASSIVPGITRDCILQIARDNGVPVEVGPFTRDHLLAADEVLLTGTAAEVTPVRELDGRDYRTGRGTLGAFLQRAYLRAVTGQDERYESWLSYVES